MKIWIGCDHAGYPMKLEVLAMLQEQGYTVEDMGCDGSRADYPELRQQSARKLLQIQRIRAF